LPSAVRCETDVSRLRAPVQPRRRVRLRTGEKARLGAEIVGAYVAVRWRLVRAGLPETVGAARRVTPPNSPMLDDPAALAVAHRLGAAVERTLGAMPFDSRCLIRSLVLVRILARRGIASSLVLGVSAKPAFAAHAWVERAGVPVLPTGERFERISEM
jgi:Transglutaminase-like superfamily